MLSLDNFNRYRPGPDNFALGERLRLDDLSKGKEPDRRPLAILISTWNRRAQLARTLAALARQEFDGFTVYLNDDGSEQDIFSLAELFSPYLDIRFRRAEREGWRSCPSSAYRAFIDEGWLEASTEAIAIMHPEMILPLDGTKLLYGLLDNPLMVDCYYESADPSKAPEVSLDHNTGLWVTMQSLFLAPPQMSAIEAVDWQTDPDNLRGLPNFWSAGGFAGQTNRLWATPSARKSVWPKQESLGCPWWFVASARADDPIWQAIPVTRGHATIDMFMVSYRVASKMLDITPKGRYCYHQAHTTAAVAPQGENAESGLDAQRLGEERAKALL